MNATVDSLRGLAADRSIVSNSKSGTAGKSDPHRPIGAGLATAACRTPGQTAV